MLYLTYSTHLTRDEFDMQDLSAGEIFEDQILPKIQAIDPYEWSALQGDEVHPLSTLEYIARGDIDDIDTPIPYATCHEWEAMFAAGELTFVVALDNAPREFEIVQYLDDISDTVTVYGVEYPEHDVLKAIDPISYNEMVNNMLDSLGLVWY